MDGKRPGRDGQNTSTKARADRVVAPGGGINAESTARPASDTCRPRMRVDIYVAEHCRVCQYSLEVARRIEADFPHVTLRVVDIARTTEPLPEAVFATPTYLLNGRLWSLGNPSPEDVEERLTVIVEKRQNQIAGRQAK